MSILKPYRKNIIILVYIVAYATLVTLFTRFVALLPTTLQMEFVVYDVIQSYCTIDDDLDIKSLKSKHSEVFDELFFINLDTAFFNSETDRIRREPLAKLLDTLDSQLDKKVIFLDYIFQSTSFCKRGDDLLINSIGRLCDQLVMPYELPPNNFDANKLNSILKEVPLVYASNYTGYLDYRPLVSGEVVYRYVWLGKVRDTRPSAVYALISALKDQGSTVIKTDAIPEPMEINYILRNDPKGRREAIRFYNASEILSDSFKFPNDVKVIFIGLFDDYLSKYNLPIDQFKTPVSNNLNGIYLIINSYLNAVIGSFLSYVSYSFIFLINLLLALFGVCYFNWKNTGRKRNILYLFECLFSILIIGILLLIVYQYHYKFPFVITSMFWCMNQQLYRFSNFLLR